MANPPALQRNYCCIRESAMHKYYSERLAQGKNNKITHSLRKFRIADTRESRHPCEVNGRLPSSASLGRAHHETHVVPPDAVYGASGRLQPEAPLGLGRHPFFAVRPPARASHVQRVHGRARIRRGARIRRDLRQRASFQRLRAHALAQPDRLVAGAPHHRHRALRHGQFARPLQSADARRRRVRDDRLHLGGPADRGLPGRLADGYLLRLRPESEPVA